MRRLSGWSLVAGGILLFLGLFLLYPTIRLTAASLLSTDYYVRFFSRPYYYQSLTNSLWLSTLSTLGCVVIGVPLAVLVSRYQIPGKTFIRLCAVLSLLSPPFIGAYAWIILLGRSGFITQALGLKGFSIYGFNGVLLVFVLHHFAYVFLLTSAALGRIDAAAEEAAETLGSPPWRRLLTITLPLALPAILAGALLAFTTALADFGTPMLIGEGLRTLPVLVYNEFLSELGGNPGMASASSLIMLAVALGALMLQGLALRGRNYAMSGMRPPRLRPLAPALKWPLTTLAWLVAGTAALPQVVIVVTSFLKANGPIITGEFSLNNYRLLLTRMTVPLQNTVYFAVTATAIMLVVGMLIAYLMVRRGGWSARAADLLLILAQVLPGTVLGVGLLVSWGRPPLMLSGTASILIIAYIVRRIAYTARAAAAGLSQISPAMEEASMTLGASPLRTFARITVPLMLPAAISGAVVSWVSTLSELSATIMLYTGRTSTVAVAIYNQVMTDAFGTAAALGTVLLVLTIISLAVLSRWSDKHEGLGL